MDRERRIWTSAALIERLGGDHQLASELVDIFLSEYPNLLAALRHAVNRGDGDAIRRAAHAVKGTVANFVEDGPATTALALERAAAESRFAEIPALMTQLEGDIELLTAAMRDEVISQ